MIRLLFKVMGGLIIAIFGIALLGLLIKDKETTVPDARSVPSERPEATAPALST